MKILFLNHNQEELGTYWRCFHFGKYLSLLGHEITMICSSGKKIDFLIRKRKINKKFSIITLPRICYHQFFTGQILLRFFPYCFFVLTIKYDLLYAFAVAQPQIAIPAILGKIIRRKKLIIDWDDLWGDGFGLQHSKLINWVFKFFERRTLFFADKITYVSEYLGKKLKKLNLINKSKKIPNGADFQKIKPLNKISARKKLGLNLKINSKLIISIGNTYTESLRLLIHHFNLAIKNANNLHLFLIGAVQIPNNIKPMLNQNIKIIGSRSSREIPYWLASADILILPMDQNSIEKARFPIRFGDYLCAKRPIISNAVGEIKTYLLKYNCGLIINNKTKDFTLAIKTLLSNKKLSTTLASRARTLAENDLSWQKISNKLNGFINN